jgi:hypothetical protein
MVRRIVVPALFVTAASGVAYALARMRRGGTPPGRAGDRPAGQTTAEGAEPQEYRCDCGQLFHVSGAGRHSVYWLPDASPSDPVLSPTCPQCERPLPREPQMSDAPAT